MAGQPRLELGVLPVDFLQPPQYGLRPVEHGGEPPRAPNPGRIYPVHRRVGIVAAVQVQREERGRLPGVRPPVPGTVFHPHAEDVGDAPGNRSLIILARVEFSLA